MKKQPSFEDLQELAISRGGECLSNEYTTFRSQYEWKCDKGHEFVARAYHVKAGSWCPHCYKTKNVCSKHSKRVYKLEKLQDCSKLKKLQDFALSKNGKCLSTTYIECFADYQWQCNKGHTFSKSWHKVQSGSWCPVCTKKIRKTFYLIKDLQDFAESKGGKCLSNEYINKTTKYKWKCNEGHEWISIFNNLKNGSWCPTCSNLNKIKKIRTKTKYTIKSLQELAESKGGKFLSKTFIKVKNKYKWQCSEGHEWNTTISAIKAGTWCFECCKLKRNRNTIKDLQTFAEAKGGSCISKNINKNNSKYKFQCKEGHTWESKGYNIKIGYWCPICRKNDK